MKKGRSGAAALALVLVGLAMSGGALAKPDADPGRREAVRLRALYDAGNSALAARDFPAASRSFAAAFRMAPLAESLFYLGKLALLEERRLAAEDLLRRYLNDPTLATTPEAQAQRQEAERLLGQAHPADASQSGEVNLIFDRSAFIFVDERLVGQLPLALPLLLPVGAHKIVLEEGTRKHQAQVTVAAGRMIEIRINGASGAVIVSLPPAVVLLADYPGVPQPVQQRLELAIATTLRRERLAMFRREAALARFPDLAACLPQPSCQAELATRAEADYVLSARIERRGQTDPARWQLRFGLVDSRVPEVAASQEASCDACTGEAAAGQAATTLHAVLQEGLRRQHGVLEVRSTPPGAEVLLDGKKLGETPWQRAMFTGSYALLLRRRGYAAAEGRVEVEPQKTATLELTLDPQAPSSPAAPHPPAPERFTRKRPLWRLVTGASALVAGAVLIGFGAPAVALDNQCIDVPISPKLQCMQRYDTLPVGGALTGVGAALLVTGGVLLALPGSLQPQGAAHAN
jgi:hypothetical protein